MPKLYALATLLLACVVIGCGGGAGDTSTALPPAEQQALEDAYTAEAEAAMAAEAAAQGSKAPAE